jgi:aspartyl-tRNA(Asn)/glutamyl-tRNA(Gln) amidotransferase subunit C
MSSLTSKEVLYVAGLAAIELKEEEVTKTLGELNQILGFIDKLQGVSTLGVEPTSHVHGSTNPFRDDVIKESLPREDIDRIAPDFVDGFFRVPKIIG